MPHALMLFNVIRRVQKLDSQRGARAGCCCAVCCDGERCSGLVFRIAGVGPTDESLPVCAGCGLCNALVFDIVPAERPAAA